MTRRLLVLAATKVRRLPLLAAALPALHAPLASAQTLEARLDPTAWGMYVNQSTGRGADGVVAVGWLTGDASLVGSRAQVALSAMASLDPLTLGDCGYPRLVAGTGTICREHPFQDRSHAHPLFVELTAHARVAVGPATLFVRGGPVGAPTLGPPSYMHRASARHDPIAPMSHHETNPAHVAKGVVGGGVQAGGTTLEGSAFNARPGDDDPYDFDVASPSSWAARLRWEGAGWQVGASLGELRDAGEAHAGHGAAEGGVRIYGASVARSAMRGSTMLDVTAAWVRHAGGALPVDAFLLEASAENGRHAAFTRLERVHRVEEEVQVVIGPDGVHQHATTPHRRNVTEVAGGYALRLFSRRGLDFSAGARAGVSFIPTFISAYYGAPRERSLAVFASVRPARAHVH